MRTIRWLALSSLCVAGACGSSSTFVPTNRSAPGGGAASVLRASYLPQARSGFHDPLRNGWRVVTAADTFYLPRHIGVRLRGTLPAGAFQFRGNGLFISVPSSTVIEISLLRDGVAKPLKPLSRFEGRPTSRSSFRSTKYYAQSYCDQPIGTSIEDDQWSSLCYCPDGSIVDLNGLCVYWVDDPGPPPGPDPTPWPDESFSQTDAVVDASIYQEPLPGDQSQSAIRRPRQLSLGLGCAGTPSIYTNGVTGRIQWSHTIVCSDANATVKAVHLLTTSFDPRTPGNNGTYDPIDVQCGGSPSGTQGGCVVPIADLPMPLGRSSIVQVQFQFDGLDQFGREQVSNVANGGNFVLNDQRQPYPKVAPYGYPFPAVPFPGNSSIQDCTGRAGVGNCAGNDPSFRPSVIAYYASPLSVGYALPPGSMSNRRFSGHGIYGRRALRRMSGCDSRALTQTEGPQ